MASGIYMVRVSSGSSTSDDLKLVLIKSVHRGGAFSPPHYSYDYSSGISPAFFRAILAVIGPMISKRIQVAVMVVTTEAAIT